MRLGDMDEQPAAPVVTISDPLHPGEPRDVMASGSEREPFRLTRRHWTALAVVAAFAGAAVLPAKVVSARAEERRRDLAAAVSAGVSLSGAGGTSLALRAEADEVHVLDLTVIGPGYEPVRVARDLRSGEVVTVSVPDTRTCERTLIRPTQLGEVRVRFRTQGGTELTRSLDLAEDAWAGLQAATRERCNWLTPSEAAEVSGTWVRVGKALEFRGTARNTGLADLLVTSLSPDTGAVYFFPQEITVPAGGTVPVRYRVETVECDQQSLPGPAALTAYVDVRGETSSSGSVQVQSEQSLLLDWLGERCG